ncbi:nucleoside hydrolase [Bacillus niameyensis]|uniref:nucleoside hydrolase n=1 Tax=Bacillus niameyensis TaxID=1522308 RepID=UPI000782FDB9|nr:nucleoside hydrolase [Bacillus niameyensis]
MELDKKRVIIDVDTGIDDAIAILFALKSPNLKVEGITTVFGNVGVEQATDNTLRVIQLAKPSYEVPVAKGAAKPLKRKLSSFSDVHGYNGLGNIELPLSRQMPVDENAEDFILRKSRELKKDLIIVTLGRLTNIAHALIKDPTLATRVKQVYVMGGAVHTTGNITPVSEANMWGDPEAADIVFSSGIPITMVGLNVTRKTKMTSQHLEFLQRHCKPENREIVSFIHNAMTFYFDFYHSNYYLMESAPVHDPLTVLVVLDPRIVKTQQMPIKIECESETCLGMTVADLRPHPEVGSPVKVCVDVNAELAINKILAVFEGIPFKNGQVTL